MARTIKIGDIELIETKNEVIELEINNIDINNGDIYLLQGKIMCC